VRKSALLWFGLVTAALVALGLIVLSSASGANGIRLHTDVYYFMKRQFLYLAVAVVTAIAMAAFDYRHWRDHWFLTAVFYVVVVVLLGAVFGFREINGSHRWISLGPVRLQPSELAKLVTVIAVAVWTDKAGWKVELFLRGALAPAMIVGGLAALVIAEPDFGSTMVILCVGFLVMFVSGTKFLHLCVFAGIGLAGFAGLLLSNANRIMRLTSEKALYQVNQALIAFKNGGLFGVGLGESMQKEYYLPEAHTDFIFAIGAEELGLVFTLSVILLFAAFFALSIYIARKASDRFGRFLVIGMTFIIFFQAMFNFGVVCKALPTKGMALPFFSYGGTNLISAFFAVGTILSVGIHSYRDTKRSVRRNVFVN
jgi:cell division protein FtsW